MHAVAAVAVFVCRPFKLGKAFRFHVFYFARVCLHASEHAQQFVSGLGFGYPSQFHFYLYPWLEFYDYPHV